MPSIPLGSFLRTSRRLLSQTQQQVARNCGVTPEAICLLERGRRLPGLDLVPRLADALHLDRRALARLALEHHSPDFYAALGEAPVTVQELQGKPRLAGIDSPDHPEAMTIRPCEGQMRLEIPAPEAFFFPDQDEADDEDRPPADGQLRRHREHPSAESTSEEA